MLSKVETQTPVKKRVWLCQAIVAASGFFVCTASAAELDDIRKTIQSFYTANEKSLLCYTQQEGIDANLIKVPERFFSKRFMEHYRPVCLGKSDFHIGFDIRSGDPNIFMLREYRAVVSKLNIETPVINGPAATVRATYDLQDFSFKEWGNFSKYKLVREGEIWKIDDVELGGTGAERESITGLPSVKSLVRYIDDNLAKVKTRKSNTTLSR